ncbi:MAG TPA: gephyrin-like molybdotransferase Glp [Bacteroidales bacterium]|nr:gephyrin-like molybdotransferase Glp [Bacteroidales bacterium]
MIPFDEALGIVMDSAFLTGCETIPFADAVGRFLAEDIFSDTDMPPFNRSAVDGFACRKQDLKNELEIIEVIPAGKDPSKKPGKNECSRIMTGAIVPEGCDFVFMIEDSEETGSNRVRYTGKGMKTNISLMGEDLKKGDVVLRKGKRITPADIAVIASVGHVNVNVGKKPSVGVISTGDELVEPENKPLISQIRNSNSYQLLAQLNSAGAAARYYGIAPDDERAAVIIKKALAENNILLLTGGVSMGDFDLVPDFLKDAGVKLMFDRVNVQPGKPTTFGVHKTGLVFGLPGNPVSSFVQFETLVKPLIYKMSGANELPSMKKVTMGADYERKSFSRMGWIPVRISESGEAFPVDYHGSAHISALSYSDGIISILPGINKLCKGDEVSFKSFKD